MTIQKKVVAKALVINYDKEMLLLYRGDTHPRFPGHFDMPGGELDGNETYTEAVIREIFEETKITVNEKSVKEIFSKSYDDVDHILFIAKIGDSTPDVELSWEHKGYAWFNKEDLLQEPVPEDCDPYYLDVLEALKSGVI